MEASKNALKIDPTLTDAQFNIALGLERKGDIDGAFENYQLAIKMEPNHALAHNNLGGLFEKKGASDDALSSYTIAVEANPKLPEAHYNLGYMLGARGDIEGGIRSYRNAIDLKPEYADAHNNLGNLLWQNGEVNAAMMSCQRAINIDKNHKEAHNNLGNALVEKYRLDDAIFHFNRAIEIEPNFASAHGNLASVLFDKKEFIDAISHYQKAHLIAPTFEEAHAQRVHLQSLICDWESLRKERQLIPSLGTGENEVSPFSMLTLEDYPERHKSRAEVYTARKFNHVALEPNARPTAKPAQLRIGYFSADFYDHPVSQLIVGVLEQHDRTQFTVYAYAYGPEKNDDVRQRLIKATDTFRDVSDKNYQEIALLARQDNIDIAIDLTGYTKNCRTAIFAYRAAPIQINYLGYPGTMGAHFMDYIIADKILIPDELKKHYTEKIIQLPYSYMPTDNTRKISNKVITRSDMGLPENGFVFCGFNNSYKISPSEFDIWMRLLLKIPDSVLWLRHSNKWSEDNLRNEAEKRTIDQSRLIFAERIPMDEHLARHQLADLFLDTFTFNAHSTTVDALWAGLPVITKPGQGFAARVAASLLNAINMPELVTHTEQEYETLALELASNPEKLKQIKHKLKINRLTTPLFDTLQYTRYLENGYQKAYQQFFNNQKPDNLYVHG